MAIILNKSGFDYAVRLIQEGEFESFDADWQEEQPTPDEVGNFLNTHYIQEYGLWFLGINDQHADTTKEYYEYPHGDLKEVQRSALVHSLAHAQKNGHAEIAHAVKKLIEMIDALNK